MQLPECLIDHPDGEIRIKGHRVSLTDVVIHDQGSLEALHAQLPSVPTTLLGEVVAFYEAHRPEVDAYVAQVLAEEAALHTTVPWGLTMEEMRERLQLRKQAGRAS